MSKLHNLNALRRVELPDPARPASSQATLAAQISHFAAGSRPHANAVPMRNLFVSIRDWIMTGRLPSERQRATRLYIAQGEPGSGKTLTLANTICALNAHACPLPGSALASGEEGGTARALDAWLAGMERLSETTQTECIGIIDDLDVILAPKPDTQVTVNANVNDVYFMHLAETPTRFVNWDDSPIRIASTGNFFSHCRASTIRDGRATLYTHHVSPDNKLDVALLELRPHGSDEIGLVEEFVRLYADEPVALWAAVARDLGAARRARVFDSSYLDDIAHMEAELAMPQTLTREDLAAAIEHRLTSGRPRNFLKQGV
jgi:hypothetical protein